MLPDLAGLVSALNAGGVQFVVIGGVAVGAHGHIRATEHLDIVPDPDRDNIDRLGNALVGLDALGDLDIAQLMPGVPGWDELAGDAETTTLVDQPVRVCSRPHLLAMKRARASLQDQADLEALANDS